VHLFFYVVYDLHNIFPGAICISSEIHILYNQLYNRIWFISCFCSLLTVWHRGSWGYCTSLCQGCGFTSCVDHFVFLLHLTFIFVTAKLFDVFDG